MPSDAPRIKLDRTRSTGAEVVLYDRYQEDRAAIAQRIATERKMVLVPPYDDARIIAGQGTLGREFAAQVRARGCTLDTLLVNCSGGGLIAGCALAFAELSAATKLYAVEPAGFDDTARSLRTGKRVANVPQLKTICDSLMVATPGELTFAINRRLLAGALVVTDAEVVAAMRYARQEFKMMLEPGGAAALAALLQRHFDARGKTVGVVLTGGNVAADQFNELTA
jgi:threonine dehydratase